MSLKKVCLKCCNWTMTFMIQPYIVTCNFSFKFDFDMSCILFILNILKYMYKGWGFVPLRSLDCRALMWVRWIVRGNGCLGRFSFITIFALNCWVLWFIESGRCPLTQVLYFLLLIKTYPVFFFIYQWLTYSFIENNCLLFISKILIIIEKWFSFMFFYIYRW